MVGINDVIWGTVSSHKWKWQTGRVSVSGIIWHATRSGIQGRTAEQEYSSTLNWFRSPNNVVRDAAGNPWFGGMSNYVIGGGKVCIAVPEEYVPRFSAGTHDFRAISVEVGQNNNGVPYDPRDIELCQNLAADLSQRYSFPLGRIPHVDGNNFGWPGEVGHEDTKQGQQQGKSDPGEEFWIQYLEEGMTKEEIELLVSNTVLPLVAQIVGPDKPTYTEPWAIEKIAAIRAHLASNGGITEEEIKKIINRHYHNTNQQTIVTGEVGYR